MLNILYLPESSTRIEITRHIFKLGGFVDGNGVVGIGPFDGLKLNFGINTYYSKDILRKTTEFLLEKGLHEDRCTEFSDTI